MIEPHFAVTPWLARLSLAGQFSKYNLFNLIRMMVIGKHNPY
jgi:hypothetical protein